MYVVLFHLAGPQATLARVRSPALETDVRRPAGTVDAVLVAAQRHIVAGSLQNLLSSNGVPAPPAQRTGCVRIAQLRRRRITPVCARYPAIREKVCRAAHPGKRLAHGQ